MVKSLSYRIILGLVFMGPNICVGSENDSWRAIGSFRSRESRDHVHTLDILYQKEGENPSAVLRLDGDQWQANIHNFDKEVVNQIQENLRFAKKSEAVLLALMYGEQEYNLCVKSAKCFYGPQEYHNLSTCKLSTNGESMKIEYRDDEGMQEVKLYQPESIKNIVNALNEGKGCIINLLQKSNPAKQIKVVNYTSSSWVWWNGWKPEALKFYGWPEMPHYDVAEKVEYNVVDIDLDEDQKHEPIYTKNQLISRWIKRLSLVSSCALLYYLLQDKIDEFLKK